jgi:hypothetical protein
MQARLQGGATPLPTGVAGGAAAKASDVVAMAAATDR